VDERYVEAVLSVVERVPAGRVTTYGAIAELVGSGGPRQVGRVMALYGGSVPWWRVVRADGAPPACHEGAALAEYRAEGTPMRSLTRLDLPRAFWQPQPSTQPPTQPSADGA
jgi:alkylated DNA nucleotide flippase Atl1